MNTQEELTRIKNLILEFDKKFEKINKDKYNINKTLTLLGKYHDKFYGCYKEVLPDRQKSISEKIVCQFVIPQINSLILYLFLDKVRKNNGEFPISLEKILWNRIKKELNLELLNLEL